ncbi:12012_t:CDS:1 [Ambispora leptoticha]|uniref:12012_t:CDS:1 n=1 Tax=Ambispora leptoticha TaxID=144679 RepID=A0A9N9FLL6_9GLOM|nr:12012_t:CDS:1 [Ambispora leptoticha]
MIIDAGHCYWKLPKDTEPPLVTANRPTPNYWIIGILAAMPFYFQLFDNANVITNTENYTLKMALLRNHLGLSSSRFDEAIKSGTRSIMVVRPMKFFSGTRSEVMSLRRFFHG